MSEYGGAAVTTVGAPAAIAVLAIAGVGLAAMRAAGVVGAAVLAAPDLVETAIAPLLRRLTDKLTAEGSTQFGLRADDPAVLLSGYRTSNGGNAGANVVALARAFESNLAHRLIAEATVPEVVGRIRRQVERIEREMAAGRFAVVESVAENTLGALREVVDGVTARRSRAERVTTAGIVGITLEDQGFTVRVATSKDDIAVVGERRGQRVAVVAGQSGRLTFDMEGFEGAACHSDLQVLLSGLRRRGLQLDDVDLHHHGSWSGGPLIRAAKASGQPLEDALVNLTEQLPKVPVRRSTSLVGVDAGRATARALNTTIGRAR